MKRFVIYTRVSTKEQGRSGLGLEAQERDIALFLTNLAEVPHEVLGRFQDVQSGKDDDRPYLSAALALVRSTPGAELLVAKLDRLSRKVSTITAIMDDPKVSLRVAAMPRADKFQLHIYAALAEQERDFISMRTKAALAEIKARAKANNEKSPLGGMRDKTAQRNAAIQRNAAERAGKVAGLVVPLRDKGASLRDIAAALNEAGVRTARGGAWHPAQVARTLERLERKGEA